MQKINNPQNYITNDADWWYIVDEVSNSIVVPPIQCSGNTSSPFTLVLCESKEECNSIIESNNTMKKTVDE
jgi:hypothetical protein